MAHLVGDVGDPLAAQKPAAHPVHWPALLHALQLGAGVVVEQYCEAVAAHRPQHALHRPPDERAPNNPWPEWPRVYKLDYGQEEAKARFGDDPRTYLIMTQKFVDDGAGKIKELHTVNIEWDKDENGRFVPKPIEGTEKVWPADLVLLAMGFRGPEDAMIEELGVERDERGRVPADAAGADPPDADPR